MTTETISTDERTSMVLVKAADLLCALPLASVIETLRCPPLVAISGAPACVTGVAMIRGATVAVVDLSVLLRSRPTVSSESVSTKAAAPHHDALDAVATKDARLVTLRVATRVVGLAVDSVIGVREFDRMALADVPPMLREALPDVLTAVASLDRELMLVLDGSRILTEEFMCRLED